MKTESIMLQNLCVPCACRCRYCLLCFNGKVEGIDWQRSLVFTHRFLSQAKVPATFAFGYCMEHPQLKEALRFLSSINSPQAKFLQCDGMKMRTEKECIELMEMLAEEGVENLNFTFYGLKEYHDAFAGRKGDYSLLLRMISAAKNLDISAGIPLTKENIGQIDALVQILHGHGCKVRLFIPHEEGRGRSLAHLRLHKEDLLQLTEQTRKLLDQNVYRAEREWLSEVDRLMETRRMLMISLRQDNIERYEKMTTDDLIHEIEDLDEQYYAAFPGFQELARNYGDFDGDLLYHRRDLFYHYRRIYARQHGMKIYDVMDERQSGSRRY